MSRIGTLALALGITLVTACARAVDKPAADSASAQGASVANIASAEQPPGTLTDWLAEMRTRVKAVPVKFEADAAAAQKEVLDVYITRQEYVEVFYGEQGKVSRGGVLGAEVMRAEKMFHDLMMLVGGSPKPEVAKVRVLVDSLDAQLAKVGTLAVEMKVPLLPSDTTGIAASSKPNAGAVQKIAGAIALIRDARAEYGKGNIDSARRLVERAYLEEFEPVEAVLPFSSVANVEELVHLRLRPLLVTGSTAPAAKIDSLFNALSTELRALSDGHGTRSAWFGVVSSFLIIVREGLEAVLLIAAMIAYLSRSNDVRTHKRKVYAGAIAGLAFTFVTWIAAQSLLPISGGNREWLEGITALVAVAVLLYVSHWIFRRTYMGGWKVFLNGKVERAIAAGSGFALAGVSFAAVYREGFETVLFYQALLVDLPASSVLLGFGIGAVVTAACGFGIIRLGLRLPLNIVFRATNAVLLFLSVAILGKGLYNLQEAGVYTPHPVDWLPSSELLSQILGFYPIAETLLAQLALVTLVAVMYVFYKRRSVHERAARAAV